MPAPTNTPWTRLYSDVKISVPGMTDAVFRQELFRCVKDFMDQTNIWLETVPVDVVPDALVYDLSLAGFGMANRLQLVYDPAAGPYKHWVQSGISMQAPGVIELVYAPSTATVWNAVVAKNIIDPVDAEKYPEIDPEWLWIIDKYRDAFFYGTLSRVESQPSKTYTNPTSAARNMLNYISQRGKARADAIAANTYGGQRWQFPQGYATIRRGGWA